MRDIQESVLEEIDDAREEITDFASELVRIPTVNPPGENYRECADAIGRRLDRLEFEVDYVVAEGRPEHTKEHPRVNVVGLRRGRSAHPLLHLNGHIDVVPPCEGWTFDPFLGAVREDRLYGRGSADMKAGLAAAIYGVEAIRRAGISLEGSIEVSATVDEESGGHAGVAWLAEQGRIDSSRIDYVIIPEPLGVDRICIGHRGVYWFKITTRGRVAHGSMPFLGINAIEQAGTLLEAIQNELAPVLAKRETKMPVVPSEARRATININAIQGGQVGHPIQSPCVADRCEVIFDRRFLIEEGFDAVRREIVDLIGKLSRENPERQFELSDLMTVHPVQTPRDSPLTAALEKAISTILGKRPDIIASPGTYDHKHMTHLAGIEQCVAYGPGILEVAHQADEYCLVEDIVSSTKVLALTLLQLTGSA